MRRFSTISLLCLICFTSIAQTDQVQTLDINLENYEYPFEVHFITIASQQQKYKMAYMDVHPSKGNGKTIMLLHGKNFNGAYWRETAKRLSAEGYRVIIPDQIGFGKSSKPDYYHYTFQQLAINTKAILDTLSITKTSVLGHSMGGMLASRFTLMYPEVVDKLILENPIGLEDWKLSVPYKPVDWWYENELKQNYEGIKKYQVENYYGGQWKSDYDEWAKLLAGWTTNKNYQLIAWNSALTYDMIFTQPVVYEFKNIKTPTLLIIGQRDRTALGKNNASAEARKTLGNYPKLGEETQKQIPNATLVKIDNAGHLPHIETFESFIRPLLEFLKQ
jgi:pimeloyl-ACP methyl ester carboxylesterase